LLWERHRDSSEHSEALMGIIKRKRLARRMRNGGHVSAFPARAALKETSGKCMQGMMLQTSPRADLAEK